MRSISVTYTFKGQRNYFQGGDMYNVICEAASKESAVQLSTPFRLVVHKFTDKHCDMLLSEPGETINKPDHTVAEFTFASERGRVSGWLVESEKNVENRIPYDEAKIERLCSRNGNVTVIDGDSGFTPVEVAISMTKQLHYALYPVKGKWIFTKIDMNRLFVQEDSTRLKVELKHNLNNRLTKSTISVDGINIGNIYFSLI